MRQSGARDRLLQTASRLFQERGFSEVGINEIIEKAETAKASFYQHFKSKTELCEAWLQEVHRRSEEMRNSILEGPGDSVEKVDRYFQGLEEFLAASDFRGCPYSNTGAVVDEGCCGIRRQIESHKASIRDFFRDLARGFTANSDRAAEVGDALFLVFSGASIEAQNLRTLWPLRSARRVAREMCEQERERNSD